MSLPGEAPKLEGGLLAVHALAPAASRLHSSAMPTRSLFVTSLYEAELSTELPLVELGHSIRTLAADDAAGRRWSRECGYKGYTSYASLNDLPKRDPAFADLAHALKPHAAAFSERCAFRLERRLRLDSLWVNLLPAGASHRAHIH